VALNRVRADLGLADCPADRALPAIAIYEQVISDLPIAHALARLAMLNTATVASLLQDPGLRELIDYHLDPMTVSAVEEELQMTGPDVTTRIVAFSIATRLLPRAVYEAMEVTCSAQLPTREEIAELCDRSH